MAMRPSKSSEKVLAVVGACLWLGSLVGCGNGKSQGSPGRDGGTSATGGVVGAGGSGGGTQADAMLGSGGAQGGSGGTHLPDASTSGGGQAGGGIVGSGAVLGSGGKVATGGMVGNGGTLGSGGAAASGGAVGSGGRIGTGGALGTDGGATCGTTGSLTCGPGQFCDLASKCGTIAGAQGTCEATGPQVSCTKEYRPVCGCDNVGYDNDCLRRAAGVLKRQEGLCGGPPDGSQGGQFGNGGATGMGGDSGSGGATASGGATGTAMATAYVGCFRVASIDYVSIQKRDFAQDQCIVLALGSPASSRPGYQVALPDNWGLSSAYVSPCNGTGTAVMATSATGTISWGSGTAYPPTTANVDVVLGVTVLDGGPTFTYVFSAQNIDLKSGC